MSVETEQDTSKCSSLSPPLAKASAEQKISAEAFFNGYEPKMVYPNVTYCQT
jgi:hypothetical protein